MPNNHTQPLVPPRGKKFDLDDYSPGYSGAYDRARAEAEIVPLRIRLNDLQDVLYADRRFSLLIVLQGIDTAGKDGTIKSVFQQVGPLGCSVSNFGVPTDEELGHDFLWRYHQRTPKKGSVVIFNRSHYEAVLVERVKNLAPKETWQGRYDQINQFEDLLSRSGTVIMKFFLHISKDEQKERLQARLDEPEHRWKFNAGDLEDRKLWDEYEKAYETALERCSSKHAPWRIVPADKKWRRNAIVASIVRGVLEDMDPRYPTPSWKPGDFKIE